ncbi:hypothetical protein QZH41_015464 [Actinostola sp. cb2023]|nr:hypothetical protein QZH41_015464 [Actinostola sp. cb2023]
MVGSKPRSQYRKTKKGKAFPGVPKWSKVSKETLQDENEIAELHSTPSTSRGTSHQLHDLDSDRESNQTSYSASRKKLADRGFKDESYESSNDETEELIGHGYRLVDLNNLSSTLSHVHKCDEVRRRGRSPGKDGAVRTD